MLRTPTRAPTTDRAILKYKRHVSILLGERYIKRRRVTAREEGRRTRYNRAGQLTYVQLQKGDEHRWTDDPSSPSLLMTAEKGLPDVQGIALSVPAEPEATSILRSWLRFDNDRVWSLVHRRQPALVGKRIFIVVEEPSWQLNYSCC